VEEAQVDPVSLKIHLFRVLRVLGFFKGFSIGEITPVSVKLHPCRRNYIGVSVNLGDIEKNCTSEITPV
jgi:hypothetical protein